MCFFSNTILAILGKRQGFRDVLEQVSMVRVVTSNEYVFCARFNVSCVVESCPVTDQIIHFSTMFRKLFSPVILRIFYRFV